jgi:imidazolonepropionase-like amidohydrolase
MAMHRIETDITRRQFLGGASAVAGMYAGFGLAPSELRAQAPGRPTLLSNLRFFDGATLAMQSGRDILVEAGRITGLTARGSGPTDAEAIDCGGRAVTPGLIDYRWHATLVGISQVAELTQDIGWVHLMAARKAGATLMHGFTSVRDTGGPVFGLKQAIDQGQSLARGSLPPGPCCRKPRDMGISGC